MRTAQFDATGSNIDIAFDQAVVVHNSEHVTLTVVECSAVFNHANTLLGAGAVCTFPSPTSLQIALSFGATLRQSVAAEAQTEVFSLVDARKSCKPNALSLLRNRVKSARDASVSAVGCVRVAAPSNPQPPIAVAEYQRRIGVCDDLQIRAASSVAASGGRQLVFDWAVAFSNASADEIQLQSGFPALGNATSITIKQGVMPQTATVIRVTLKLRSIFNTITSKVIEVKRVLDRLPSVEINSRSSVLKHDMFVVVASGTIPACANGATANAAPSFVYTWEMWSIAAQAGQTDDSESSREEVVALNSLMQQGAVRYTDKRKSGLRFISHALSACTRYRFRCNVSYDSGDGKVVTNWHTREVAVTQGKIVAIISGQTFMYSLR